MVVFKCLSVNVIIEGIKATNWVCDTCRTLSIFSIEFSRTRNFCVNASNWCANWCPKISSRWTASFVNQPRIPGKHETDPDFWTGTGTSLKNCRPVPVYRFSEQLFMMSHFLNQKFSFTPSLPLLPFPLSFPLFLSSFASTFPLPFCLLFFYFFGYGLLIEKWETGKEPVRSSDRYR